MMLRKNGIWDFRPLESVAVTYTNWLAAVPVAKLQVQLPPPSSCMLPTDEESVTGSPLGSKYVPGPGSPSAPVDLDLGAVDVDVGPLLAARRHHHELRDHAELGVEEDVAVEQPAAVRPARGDAVGHRTVGDLAPGRCSVKPGGMSTLSLNSVGNVYVTAPLVSVSGWIEKPWRWNGWLAPVALLTASWRMSPTFA